MKNTPNKFFLILALPIFAFALAACSTTSTAGSPALKGETNAKLQTQLIKGKTTEAQTRKLFGDPANVVQHSDGTTTWDYVYSETHTRAIPYVSNKVSTDNLQLHITFDKDVVENYTLSQQKNHN